MTDLNIVTKCCGTGTRFVRIETGIPIPRFLLWIAHGTPPQPMTGWRWECLGCDSVVGVSYDYGALDLGIVRDSTLHDTDDLVTDGMGGW